LWWPGGKRKVKFVSQSLASFTQTPTIAIHERVFERFSLSLTNTSVKRHRRQHKYLSVTYITYFYYKLILLLLKFVVMIRKIFSSLSLYVPRLSCACHRSYSCKKNIF
jgi:hypothetical protein